MGAAKKETIQRYEKVAGSFNQDPVGLRYGTSIFLICEDLWDGEECEKMQEFGHQEAHDPVQYLSSSSGICIQDSGIIA